MDFVSIFGVWLGIFSVSFTFLPMAMVLDWKRRGTADGFSSVNLVLPLVVTCCWLGFGYLTNDKLNLYMNTLNIGFFFFYISAFAYYQPKRKYLGYQLLAALITLKSVFFFVYAQDPKHASDVMGSIAAGAQILSLAGGVYEIKRAISMGTTEYIPAFFQYALFTLIVQWLAFGLLTNNIYMAAANAAGLTVNLATIALYFFYPPLTWRVPIIGTGPSEKKKE